MGSPRGPLSIQIFSQTSFRVFLWGYFWMNLTWKSEDWLKASSNPLKDWVEWKLPWIESWIRGDFSCLTAFQLGHQFFPAFGSELKYWLLDRTYNISSCAFQVFTLEPDLHHWFSLIPCLLNKDLETSKPSYTKRQRQWSYWVSF